MLTAMAILFLMLAVVPLVLSRRENAVNAKMLFYVLLFLFLMTSILRIIRGP
jgi:hypothetical protein